MSNYPLDNAIFKLNGLVLHQYLCLFCFLYSHCLFDHAIIIGHFSQCDRKAKKEFQKAEK
jgi:hypothetical protein